MRFRSIFAALVAVPMLLALTACGGRTSSQLQADVVTIASGLSGIATDLAAVPGLNIPAATMTQIQNEIALVKSQAAEIGAAAAPGQQPVADFVETVDELATLLQPFFPQAPAVAAVVTAAASLAQIVLQESGALSVSQSRVWTMPTATARAVLRSAH